MCCSVLGQCWGWGFFGEGDFLISIFSLCLSLFSPPMYVYPYNVVHHPTSLPPIFSSTPSSSSSSSSAPLQLTLPPSKKRKGLASAWSVRGGSACTQSLPSWASSCAAAVWARPGARAVTSAPYKEQVRPPSHGIPALSESITRFYRTGAHLQEYNRYQDSLEYMIGLGWIKHPPFEQDSL